MSARSDDGYAPLDKQPVREPRTVYRFAHVDTAGHARLPRDFRSDRERKKRPVEREIAIPELREGMSAYASLEDACLIWTPLKIGADRRGEPLALGDYIAEVVLAPDQDFFIEDLAEEDGHITIWGDKHRLAAVVKRLYPAAEVCRHLG